MDTFDDEKMPDEPARAVGMKPKSGVTEDDDVLPPGTTEDESEEKEGGDLENLDAWGIETDLEE